MSARIVIERYRQRKSETELWALHVYGAGTLNELLAEGERIRAELSAGLTALTVDAKPATEAEPTSDAYLVELQEEG